MLFLDQIERERKIMKLGIDAIALDSGVYPDSHKKITFPQGIQCVYGECKYLPKCPRGCLGARMSEDWLTENLPPTTAPYNPRPEAEYGVHINE